MKRLLVASAIAALALATAAVALAATTLTIPANPTGKLAFTKKAVVAKAGKVTLKMPNASIIPHDIALRKGTRATGKTLAKGKIVAKGGVSKITLTLKKGKYRYFCTVPGHEAAGMWGILTVK